jgi:hypothetical protein
MQGQRVLPYSGVVDRQEKDRDSTRGTRVEFVSLLGKSLKAAQIHEHFRPQFFSQTNKITGS